MLISLGQLISIIKLCIVLAFRLKFSSIADQGLRILPTASLNVCAFFLVIEALCELCQQTLRSSPLVLCGLYIGAVSQRFSIVRGFIIRSINTQTRRPVHLYYLAGTLAC